MAIFRGTGGATTTTDAATIEEVTTQAINAANSATSAASSASSAATSASSASSSADTATTQASAASTSATEAASSASAASTSETNASTSATAAAASATTAASEATNAETAETGAVAARAGAEAAQTAAETAESNAETFKDLAETAKNEAAAILDDFDDRYLGAKTSDPATDNDGDALTDGAVYFSTTDAQFKVYNATLGQWQAGTLSQSELADVDIVATNINDVTTAADNITAIQNASTNATNAANSATAAATSETNAATSATAAANSASSAATSETNAATSESNASTSESNASDSASDALKLAVNPEDSEYTLSDGTTTGLSALHYAAKAEDSASSAATSETNASLSESNANNSAGAASASATAAGTFETNAATSATEAATSATNAATSETNAATSATSASTSATASANSATASATSASEAATSETNAATSATAASTSETNASNSATAASTSESNASASATAAATSATNASDSATSASTSATAAANSATSASTSATTATNAANSAESALDEFTDLYLGVKASDPTLDNDGNALQTGAIYYNSTNSALKLYNGSAWVEAVFDAAGTVTSFNTRQGAVTLSTSDVTTALGYTPLNKAGDTLTGSLVLSGDPTANLQATTKQYVDSLIAAGVHYHTPVRVESPDSVGNLNATYDNGTSGVGATLTNAGTQAALVIDNVTLSTSDRVLIYNQTNAFENGIYTVTDTGSVSTNWVLTRATDADSYGVGNDSLSEGTSVFVLEGDDGSGEVYACTTTGTITFGTTAIEFAQIGASAVIPVATQSEDGLMSSSDKTKIDGIEAGATADQTASEIKTAYESNADTNAFTDANVTKLANIEANADVTDTANVTAAGALMDSEVTNLDQVKAFASSDYATAAQGTLADSAVQPSDNISTLTNDSGYITGNQTITLSGDVTGSGTTGITTSIASDVVGAAELNVSGNGTTSQFLRSDGDGSFSWVTPPDTNTTYSAGTGLNISGTTFSIESDLRGEVQYIGYSSSDYIQVQNTVIDFRLDGALDMRLYNNGDLHVEGNLIAYSTSISDERLKKDIQPIENAVAKVSQLNGYTFEYIPDGKISAGVIAQDVEKVLPEAVSETILPLKTGDEEQEYKVVNYDALQGLLIEAVKELTKRVEDLEAKL